MKKLNLIKLFNKLSLRHPALFRSLSLPSSLSLASAPSSPVPPPVLRSRYKFRIKT